MTQATFSPSAASTFKPAPTKVAQPTMVPQVQSVANLPTPVQMKTAVAPVDIRNPMAVSNYGAQAQDQVGKFADQVLEYVKTSNSGEVGPKLVQIVGIARELNISDLNGNTSKIPLIGPLIDSFRKKRERFVSKFTSLKDQIDNIIKELDVTSANLGNRNKLLEQLYEHNMQEYKELEVLVDQGKAFVQQQREEFMLQRDAAVLSGQINDPVVAQSYTDWKASIDRFEKRVSDLEAIKMMAIQAMPEIRMIQSNNQMLIEKFNNAKTLTIPAWKKQFVLAVSLDEQKQAANLAQTVDDATNEFYRNNAKLLGENAISVAKSNQRSIIDLESLEVMQSTLINTFEEMQNIENEGQKHRAQMSTRMTQMKDELYQKLVIQK